MEATTITWVIGIFIVLYCTLQLYHVICDAGVMLWYKFKGLKL